MRRTTKLLTMLACTMALVATVPAMAENLNEIGEEQCEEMPADELLCPPVEAGLEGSQRLGGGISFSEGSEEEGDVEVEVADFYFNARITTVRDGGTVVFKNLNPPGGNHHSVKSNDIGGTTPVVPLAAEFGGGRAFTSPKLSPGSEFRLHIDLATMDPAGYQRLPGGGALIEYHCYIHGPSQMNAFLLVEGADG